MTDFFSEIRSEMVENFQISLRAIRRLMGYSAAELAEYVGLTRQTINNLETGKAKMSVVQFLALAAVVDHYATSNGEMFRAIRAIMDSNYRKINRSYDTSFSDFSLLKRWFSTFDNFLDTENEDSNSLMQKLAGNYKIFLDADVFLAESAESFIHTLMNCLSSEKADVIIPLRAIERLQELTQSEELSEQAIRALRLISLLQRNSMVQIRGEQDDATLHETFLSVFKKFRSVHRLCIFTQDAIFADDVLSLNHTPDAYGFDILACYVDKEGEVSLYLDSSPDSTDEPALEEEMSDVAPETEPDFPVVDKELSDEVDKEGEEMEMCGWGML